jgi:23S rRNA (adenine2503-C2)-methyltransferase
MQLQKTCARNFNKINLKDLSLSDLENLISSLGKEKFRAGQIMKWLYQQGVSSISDMTNLSKEFRQNLEEIAAISTLEIVKIQKASDGTQKILFRLSDNRHIESVLIPGKSHPTLCISTQVGCRMGCAFCLTGKQGFKRNLMPSEITDQITLLKKNLPEGKEIGNIVIMGMGEPLDNYAHVLKAIEIMSCDLGLSFSGRKITLSTCGVVPMIEKLGKDVCVNLAVSLNAADDRARSLLMPINKKYPIEPLIKACQGYEMPRRRRITFEYILIDQVNASPNDAEKLAKLLRGVRCKINLIAFNEHPGSPFKSPSQETIEAFRNVLVKHNYTAVQRASKGRDILAACGQLSGEADA